MIDYQKLLQAHQLASSISNAWVWISTKYSAQEDEIEYRLEMGLTLATAEEYLFDDVDKLITKLRELTQQKPKYENWWYIDGDFKITRHNFTDEEWQELSQSRKLEMADAPSKLYPSRQALIEAQIEYWQKLARQEFYKDLPLEGEIKGFNHSGGKQDGVYEIHPTICKHQSDGHKYHLCEDGAFWAVNPGIPENYNKRLRCALCYELYCCIHEPSSTETHIDEGGCFEVHKCGKCGVSYR